jgi:coenzyme Q-binding protein COQ10
MASASISETMNAPIEKVYQVLTDYEKNPEFMDGVTSAEVLSRDGNTATVKFNIDIIKKFTYTIKLTETAPTELSWVFVEGDLFKSNTGKWKLTDNGDGTTLVEYSLDVNFKMMVPGMISKKLVSSNLPNLMKNVNKRAQAL